MTKRILVNIAKALIAFPYRFRFASLGKSVRIVPPLLLRGAKRIHIGEKVIIEQFAGLSVVQGGEIIIGNGCELRCFSRLEAHHGGIRLGAFCSVNPFTLLSGFGGLVIGKDVSIGSHSVILSSTHQFESTYHSIRDQGIKETPTAIEDDVWIGAGCIILGGVRIGYGSVIGAGSVVNRDVPPLSIATGVPAKLIGNRRSENI